MLETNSLGKSMQKGIVKKEVEEGEGCEGGDKIIVSI